MLQIPRSPNSSLQNLPFSKLKNALPIFTDFVLPLSNRDLVIEVEGHVIVEVEECLSISNDLVELFLKALDLVVFVVCVQASEEHD